jgi:hypothetical protein
MPFAGYAGEGWWLRGGEFRLTAASSARGDDGGQIRWTKPFDGTARDRFLTCTIRAAGGTCCAAMRKHTADKNSFMVRADYSAWVSGVSCDGRRILCL